MGNYAAIDLGTNSCRLLVASRKKTVLARDLQTTRLGEGLTETGLLSEKSIRKTLQCLKQFKETMAHCGVKDYRIVATSAVRESANQEDFVRQVTKETGLKLDVITPEEEAYLSYRGVTEALELAAPPLVVDLGGGSTEFMHYEGEDRYWISLPVGAVRATEANMTADELLRRLEPVIKLKDRFQNSPLVFVGGTATNAVAMKLGLREYRPELVHGQVLVKSELADLYHMVKKMSLDLLRRLPGLQPERADIIGQGLLIVYLIVDSLGKSETVVSESDLLQGIIGDLSDAG